MTETQTTNLNSMLIEVCHKYLLIIRELQLGLIVIQKCYDVEEVHDRIRELHALYVSKLQETDELIDKIKIELELSEFDLTDFTDFKLH